MVNFSVITKRQGFKKQSVEIIIAVQWLCQLCFKAGLLNKYRYSANATTPFYQGMNRLNKNG